MEKLGPNDIIFLMKITNKESFAKFSNFINKVSKHELLHKEETENILFKRGDSVEGEVGTPKWHRSMGEKYRSFLLNENKKSIGPIDFKEIQQPEGISKVSNNFRIIYYLLIEEKDLYEIVQYRELILLMEGYKSASIHAQIVGSKNFYFKLSQYLFWTVEELGLKNNIYYNDQEGVKRIQQFDVKQSTAFLPLIVVNQENLTRLKDKCFNQLGESFFRNILLNEKKCKDFCNDIEWKELGGIVMQLHNNFNIYKNLEKSKLLKVFKQLDVLALALLAYSMKNYKSNLSIAELNSYARVQQQYANACHQLMENIIFHSAAKWGLLSVRIHSSKENESNRYLTNYYEKKDVIGDYFEVHICDFSGEKNNCNIAEHFLNQMNATWQKKFLGIKPENLFKSALNIEDEYIGVWKEYYQVPNYFGKHFGLRIFQGIVKANSGFFSAESYTNHKISNRENYYYGIAPVLQNFVMPGTAYGILLPLKKGQEQVDKDITQEYGEWLCRKPERILNLKAYNFKTEFGEGNYQNQEIKNNLIRQRTDKIRDCIENKIKDENIISINASKFQDNEAEVWGKAILSAQFGASRKPHFVLYECTETFMSGFSDVMRQMFSEVIECLFWDDAFQVALISKDNEQFVYLPGNVDMTDNLNQYISRMKGIKCDTIFGTYDRKYNIGEIIEAFIPYDVIIEMDGETIFERYVKKVLEEDIQSEKFGCKISPTHMRLGSTIHIDKFYEGELMLGNVYFVSRFAFLILKDLYDYIQKSQERKIILYGYASYSETLLVTLKKAMLALSEELKIDVKYILLEREEERREREHVDRIRYCSELPKQEYKGYKFVVIVPINSTMKTHQRLISLLHEEVGTKDENILCNYALILVGPEKCDYWEKTKNNSLVCKYVKPDPKYFICVETEYQESLTCEMCFSPDVIWETPLIEVNAASTIPNQAFGVVSDKKLNNNKLKEITEIIVTEEKNLKVLKECLIYGHVTRNDTHFLYYVKTEELTNKSEDAILESLQNWKSNILINDSEYHIIVAPMHYSNCQFVEMVNEQIFSGVAYVIRIDFNKDFRNNAYAKYSNIRQYLRQLAEMDREIKVKFHYVDDNIITGRTFFRAKSLIESIVSLYKGEYSNVETVVFDRVFTLLDRNSTETRMQYLSCAKTLEDVEKYFYSFLHVNISSLRNYGDSCTICNLQKEAERLHHASATAIVAGYWEDEDTKFSVTTIDKFIENKNKKFDEMQLDTKEREEKIEKEKERAYRRLFCTHVLKVVLEEVGYDNRTEYVSKILLSLFLADYKYRCIDQGEAFEYFISYLKICSRPFLVFQKPIKEAVYDILLIIMECIIKEENVNEVIKRGKQKKTYWSRLEKHWKGLEECILDNLNEKQRLDLVLVIMKQLTELKSNYIIRLNNMNALFAFIKPYKEAPKKINITVGEDFWTRYVIYIKKLTGVSSDTSKSMWLDYALMNHKEMNFEEIIPPSPDIEPLFAQIVRLENTTNFQDGINKIYRLLKTNPEAWSNIQKYTDEICDEARVHYVVEQYLLKWVNSEEYKDLENSRIKWKEEFLRHTSMKCAICPGNVREAYNSSDSIKEIVTYLFHYLSLHIRLMNVENCKSLKCGYQSVTEGYQFFNFRRLMCELNWGEENSQSDNKEYEYTDEGVKQITCCLAIKKLCEEADHTEEALLKRIDRIAKLAGAILGDNPVQIWAEYQDSSEYYKKVIEQMLEEKGRELGLKKEDLPLLKIRRHYHTIGDNAGSIPIVAERAQDLLNLEEVQHHLNKYGYYFKGEDFLWKMGRKSRYPLYLYAVVGEDKENFIYKVRNLLSLSNDIEKSLFSAGKQNYLHEMDLANSQLSVLNREKSYSHTKAENRIRNYKRLAEGDKSSTHDSLVLLSDLNVSRIYRESLNKEFYKKSGSFGEMSLNMSIFRNDIKERMHGEYSETDPVVISIHNEAFSELQGDQIVNENEKLIFANESEQDIMSLLLVLLLNVKEKERGIIDGQDGKIHIYLSKTSKGMLRILNKTKCDEAELAEIEKCMWSEPTNDESGITLWSLSACIKRAIVCCVHEKLESIDGKEKVEEIEKVLNRLTEKDFEIKLNIIKIGKDNYFSYELPIFRELYDKE